jgi:hypothetical protein
MIILNQASSAGYLEQLIKDKNLLQAIKHNCSLIGKGASEDEGTNSN